MATLPDVAAEQKRPVPQPSLGAAQYEPPNWRQVGMAGYALSDAGKEMEQAADIVAQTNLRQDTIAANAAMNQLHEKALTLELDPKTGFKTQLGGNAVGQQFIDSNVSRFSDAAQGIYDTLQNDQQKALFRERAPIAALSYRAQLLQHQQKETLVFNHQVTEDTINNGIADIAAHPYDDGTYNKQLELMQQAIAGQGKRLMGEGDAALGYFKDKSTQVIGKALFYRTSAMLQDSPQAAADFFHAHETEFDPNDRRSLGQSIKGAMDGQASRAMGTQAYQQAVAVPTPSALPQNWGARDVRPYGQAQIDGLKKMVQAPSKYDDIFQRAGALYNVSPAELKFRAAAESGMNPDAASHDRGGNVIASGLMQFETATARNLGIDPKDPEQAIFAAAKLMAQAGGTMGRDMTPVDTVYHGGPDPKLWGPNTKQYVDNLRSARQQIFGAPPAQSTLAELKGKLPQVLENARRMANERRPGDQTFEDRTVTEAHAQWARDVQALENRDYANTSSVLGAVEQTKAITPSELPPNIQSTYQNLSPENVRGVQAQMERNARQARGEFTRSDPRMVNDLRQRIYLPDGDPNKITQPGQLTPYLTSVNYSDMEHLRKEMVEANTPEGNPFLKQVNEVKEKARKMLTGAMTGPAIAHPELAEEAAYRFSWDLDQKIKDARAKGVDPLTLFDYHNKDFVLNPSRVGAYMPTEAQIAEMKARGLSQSLIQPRPGETVPEMAQRSQRLPGETPAAWVKRMGGS